MARKLNRIIFTLRDGEDFIPLISLLKACDVVYSGSEAQEVVSNGMVQWKIKALNMMKKRI